MSKWGEYKDLSYTNINVVLKKKLFIAEIATMREEWNIPEHGFTNESDFNNWLAYRRRKTESIHKETRVKEVHYLPYYYGDNLKEIELVKTDEFNTVLDISGNSSQYSLFLDNIKTFRSRLGLSEHWDTFLCAFILRNKIIDNLKVRSGRTNYSAHEPTVIKKVYDTGKVEELINIEITSNTKPHDFKVIWNKVKKIQKLLIGRDKSRRKIKSDRDIKSAETTPKKFYENPKHEYKEDSHGREIDSLDAITKGRQRILKEINRPPS